METRHVRLEYAQGLNGKKQVLSSEISLIYIAKILLRYKMLRKKEFTLKNQLKTSITALKTILMLKDHTEKDWLPNIIKAIASENFGINKIADEVQKHSDFLVKHGFLKEKREENYRVRIKEIVESLLKNEIWQIEREKFLDDSLKKVIDGSASPYQVAEILFNNYKRKHI